MTELKIRKKKFRIAAIFLSFSLRHMSLSFAILICAALIMLHVDLNIQNHTLNALGVINRSVWLGDTILIILIINCYLSNKAKL